MQWVFQSNSVRQSWAVWILLFLPMLSLAGGTDTADQLAEIKSRYELEKAKNDLLEQEKRQATLEKEKALAQIPDTKTTALAGTVDVKNFGAAGLIVAIDLAKELAGGLCNEITSGNKVFIYDPAITSGIVSARMLETQLALYQTTLKEALKEEVPDKTFEAFMPGLAAGAAVASGTVKALADLASLFKTNITVTNTGFNEAKSLLVTAMAGKCPEKLSHLGVGYSGELDMASLDKLREASGAIISDRAKLENRIGDIKKKLESVKDPVEKKALQSRLDDLSSVAKLVDGFITVIKPNDITDKSPLFVAAKFLTLSKTIAGSDVLDIEMKLEGLSIIKENIFTGQNLRLSATGIVWYRIQDITGSLKKSGVMRKLAKPIQVDLRGDDANEKFWNGN